jgi:hypothetical protein
MTGVSGAPVNITDCYSRGDITAQAAPGHSGGAAVFSAGGIAGRVSLAGIRNSYAAGIITASGLDPDGTYTHAGGIAAVLYGQASSRIDIQQCAALSPRINWKLFTIDNMILKRIGIRGEETVQINIELVSGRKVPTPIGEERYPLNTTLDKNIANERMILNYEPSPLQEAKVPPPIVPVPGYDTEDGANCEERPTQAVFTNLGGDFSRVWKMGSDGYPIFVWQGTGNR